jgi:hypothetical protein
MEDEDKNRLKEIHEVILGTYEKVGLIGRIVKLEEQNKMLKVVAGGLTLPMIGILGERIASLIM